MSCWVYTASGLAQLHDFLSNGLAHAVLFTIGIGALFACYQLRVHHGNGDRPRLVFLALLVVSVLVGAGLTFVGTRAVSTSVTCEEPGRGWADPLTSTRFARFGVPAYAVEVSIEGDGSPERRADAVALVVDVVFWTGLACVFLVQRASGTQWDG